MPTLTGCRVIPAEGDERMPTAEADRGQRAGITRRHLQIALGVLWILDGALQLQPFMYSRSFVPSVLGAAATGQPHLLAAVMQHADHLMAGQLAVVNTGAALVQIAIGAGLL